MPLRLFAAMFCSMAPARWFCMHYGKAGVFQLVASSCSICQSMACAPNGVPEQAAVVSPEQLHAALFCYRVHVLCPTCRLYQQCQRICSTLMFNASPSHALYALFATSCSCFEIQLCERRIVVSLFSMGLGISTLFCYSVAGRADSTTVSQ